LVTLGLPLSRTSKSAVRNRQFDQPARII